MKNSIKYLLHRLLGFRNYLFYFSLFKVFTLKKDRKEGDFFRFLELVPRNTAVLDIGANIGIMTVHLARHIGAGRVYSFEPMPANIEAFNRVVRYFKLNNVSLYAMALGNEDKEVEMVMPVLNNVKLQGLSHVVHESIKDFNEGVKFKVPLKALDHMPEIINSPLRVSGIKIDIENFEFYALDGAKELIKKHKPVVYAELWDNENRSKCFELLSSLGYSTHVSCDGKLVIFDAKKHKKQNFIFIPA
jgi:FkbM family methyltransferase